MTGLMIHPKVAEEMADAAKWYREIDPELALRFLDEVYEAIGKARDIPALSTINFQLSTSSKPPKRNGRGGSSEGQ